MMVYFQGDLRVVNVNDEFVNMSLVNANDEFVNANDELTTRVNDENDV